MQSGTGTQKLAEVMLLTGAIVTAVAHRRPASPPRPPTSQSLISAVVAILNVQTMPTNTPAANGA